MSDRMSDDEYAPSLTSDECISYYTKTNEYIRHKKRGPNRPWEPWENSWNEHGNSWEQTCKKFIDFIKTIENHIWIVLKSDKEKHEIIVQCNYHKKCKRMLKMSVKDSRPHIESCNEHSTEINNFKLSKHPQLCEYIDKEIRSNKSPQIIIANLKNPPKISDHLPVDIINIISKTNTKQLRSLCEIIRRKINEQNPYHFQDVQSMDTFIEKYRINFNSNFENLSKLSTSFLAFDKLVENNQVTALVLTSPKLLHNNFLNISEDTYHIHCDVTFPFKKSTVGKKSTSDGLKLLSLGLCNTVFKSSTWVKSYRPILFCVILIENTQVYKFTFQTLTSVMQKCKPDKTINSVCSDMADSVTCALSDMKRDFPSIWGNVIHAPDFQHLERLPCQKWNISKNELELLSRFSEIFKFMYKCKSSMQYKFVIGHISLFLERNQKMKDLLGRERLNNIVDKFKNICRFNFRANLCKIPGMQNKNNPQEAYHGKQHDHMRAGLISKQLFFEPKDGVMINIIRHAELSYCESENSIFRKTADKTQHDKRFILLQKKFLKNSNVNIKTHKNTQTRYKQQEQNSRKRKRETRDEITHDDSLKKLQEKGLEFKYPDDLYNMKISDNIWHHKEHLRFLVPIKDLKNNEQRWKGWVICRAFALVPDWSKLKKEIQETVTRIFRHNKKLYVSVVEADKVPPHYEIFLTKDNEPQMYVFPQEYVMKNLLCKHPNIWDSCPVSYHEIINCKNQENLKKTLSDILQDNLKNTPSTESPEEDCWYINASPSHGEITDERIKIYNHYSKSGLCDEVFSDDEYNNDEFIEKLSSDMFGLCKVVKKADSFSCNCPAFFEFGQCPHVLTIERYVQDKPVASQTVYNNSDVTFKKGTKCFLKNGNVKCEIRNTIQKNGKQHYNVTFPNTPGKVREFPVKQFHSMIIYDLVKEAS